MTRNPLTVARQRSQYAIAATTTTVPRGYNRAESQKLTAWLRAKGEPALHPWRRKGAR